MEETTIIPTRRTWVAIVLMPAAIAAILAIAAAGIVAGYGSALGLSKASAALQRAETSGQAAISSGATQTPPLEVPLFHDWPDARPDLVLVIGAETLGYMRPCGCSEGQRGGLARRAGLITFLQQEKQWPTLLIDSGDLVKGGGLLPWDKVRYHYIVESLKALGCKVLGVGEHDLTIPDQTVVGEALNSDPPLTMVLGNVESDDDQFQAVAGEVIPPMKIVEESGVKVGVGSLIGDAHAEELSKLRMRVLPAAEAAGAILQKMNEAGAALKVLLAHLSKPEGLELAKRVPGFDLIVCDSGGTAAIPDDAVMSGSTMVTFIGTKGMSLGLVGYWREGEPRLKFDVVPVDARFPERDDLNDLYARYVKQVEEEAHVTKLNRLPAPNGGEFVGSEQCAACHRKAYEHWKKSKHSRALHTLEVAKPDGQHYNPECIACHVIGWKMDHNVGKPAPFASGFVSYDQTPQLGNVGCESCHGPGKKHAGNPLDMGQRALMRVTRNEQDCRQCHDLDNSLHFQFETYWEKVKHPWRD